MIRDWHIIDSTLREGEQFAVSNFSLADKIEIAKALDAFGVEFLELTTPIASKESRRALETIASLGLNAKILTHTRANIDDARAAVDCGVYGVDILFASSVPAFISDEAYDLFADGENIQFDFENAVLNSANQKIRLEPVPKFLQESLELGSVLEYYKKYRRFPSEGIG